MHLAWVSRFIDRVRLFDCTWNLPSRLQYAPPLAATQATDQVQTTETCHDKRRGLGHNCPVNRYVVDKARRRRTVEGSGGDHDLKERRVRVVWSWRECRQN